ncbi:MAG: cytochrome C [Nitrospirae bacterium GWD2_57_9]|nr:MAG: cytochrome C [Nitrospirae bacterium GWD2_57_9]OGW46123.1 MAG: cytochrome C [Nitrospirae bacterium GWC2_57_9]
MTKTSTKLLLSLVVPLLLFGMYACAHTTSMATVHPTEVPAFPVCSDCHTDSRAALNHTSDFSTTHKFYAVQNKQACTICHKESFCSDCHAHKEEIKPSDKYKDSVERALPHRGDYLNQHKIDGRVNPASCMKCHGRSNNERCRVCHK